MSTYKLEDGSWFPKFKVRLVSDILQLNDNPTPPPTAADVEFYKDFSKWTLLRLCRDCGIPYMNVRGNPERVEVLIQKLVEHAASNKSDK